MENLVTPKIKKFEIKPEVLRAIHFHAKVNMDGIYSEGFSEDEQCGGYHAFKSLVLQREPLPETHVFPKEFSITGGSEPGMYYLSRLHPNIRERALQCAAEIRKLYKIANYESSK